MDHDNSKFGPSSSSSTETKACLQGTNCTSLSQDTSSSRNIGIDDDVQQKVMFATRELQTFRASGTFTALALRAPVVKVPCPEKSFKLPSCKSFHDKSDKGFSC
jgi:hypothetical protein